MQRSGENLHRPADRVNDRQTDRLPPSSGSEGNWHSRWLAIRVMKKKPNYLQDYPSTYLSGYLLTKLDGNITCF